nr:hypothetical protein HmN_000485000 [Hymenolepis microstoma]
MTSLKKNSNRRNFPCQGGPPLLQTLQRNAGGMSQDKKIQTQNILVTYNIDIFTIMESKHTDDKLTHYRFPGYTVHLLPKDRILRHTFTTMEPEQLLTCSWFQAASARSQRKIIDDRGSGHKPVIANITINSKSNVQGKLFPVASIIGNERADTLAKKGITILEAINQPISFYTMKILMRREFKTSRNNELKARTKEKQWTVALSNIADWPRLEAVAEFRLRTEHDCLAKHLHRIGVYAQPTRPPM